MELRRRPGRCAPPLIPLRRPRPVSGSQPRQPTGLQQWRAQTPPRNERLGDWPAPSPAKVFRRPHWPTPKNCRPGCRLRPPRPLAARPKKGLARTLPRRPAEFYVKMSYRAASDRFRSFHRSLRAKQCRGLCGDQSSRGARIRRPQPTNIRPDQNRQSPSHSALVPPTGRWSSQPMTAPPSRPMTASDIDAAAGCEDDLGRR